MTEKICKNCGYYDNEYYGGCEKITESDDELYTIEDGILVSAYNISVTVGPKFGCIHWKDKE
jgi:hypothetical protein